MASHGTHAVHPAWWKRWWVIAGAVVLVAAGAATAVAVSTGGPSPAEVAAKKAQLAAEQAAAQAAAHTAAVRSADAQLLASLTVSPTSGATGVAPDATVTVTTPAGSLTSVRVTDSTGAAVTGSLAPSGLEWRSTGNLRAGATYHVVAAAAQPGGIGAQKETTFATLTPTAEVTASVWPSSGLSVGVGQPLVLTFSHDITTAAAQAAVLSHITVSMSTPVAGGWYWFSPHELHFRPKAYWPSGERVSVSADLNGWNAGGGQWGSGTLTDAFSIGDARISIANLATEQMQVTLNGKTVAVYPISGGRPQYPTMDGIHVVLDRESLVHMDSATVGIPVNSPNGYNEIVYDDVHISDSGEYVHAAPWSVSDQGFTNVSHGCINISPANAQQFFQFSRVGDIVEVVGGPRPAAQGDHGVMDWSGPAWSQWTPATVHALA